jgi:hypothetical protein
MLKAFFDYLAPVYKPTKGTHDYYKLLLHELPSTLTDYTSVFIDLVDSNNTRFVEEFLNRRLKFDIDGTDKNGDTALMIATKRNHEDMIKLLVKSGADILKKDSQGRCVCEYEIDLGKEICKISEYRYYRNYENYQKRNREIHELLCGTKYLTKFIGTSSDMSQNIVTYL